MTACDLQYKDNYKPFEKRFTLAWIYLIDIWVLYLDHYRIQI